MLRVIGGVLLAGVLATIAKAGPPAIQNVEKAKALLADLRNCTRKSDADGNVIYLDISEQDAVTDAHLAALAHLPHLKEFHAIYCPITGNGLAHAVRLRQLETLNLHATRIDDRALRHIARLKTLKHLNVQSIAVSPEGTFQPGLISDEGIASIAELPHLVTLRVSGRFTDQGLRRLTNLKTLRTVEFVSPNITQSGLKRLKRAMPQVEFE